jgi:Zn finger protein HypA/HybF involved in hydrogenase expression
MEKDTCKCEKEAKCEKCGVHFKPVNIGERCPQCNSPLSKADKGQKLLIHLRKIRGELKSK